MATPTDDELIGQWELVHAAAEVTHRQLLRRLEQAGVPSAWFTVLRLLLAAEDRRLPMSTLAREVAMTTGGFTKLADRMAREGMIDRRGSSGDRRVVYATLTETGAEVAVRSVAEFGAALREQVLTVISVEQLGDISAALGALQAAHTPGRTRRDDAAAEDAEPADADADDDSESGSAGAAGGPRQNRRATDVQRPRLSPSPTSHGDGRGRP